MINRIPVTDISPVIHFGGELVPVKAIAGEEIPITAKIFREGHDQLGADVILFSDAGREISRVVMSEQWHGGESYTAVVKIPSQGTFPSLSNLMTTHLPPGYMALR